MLQYALGNITDGTAKKLTAYAYFQAKFKRSTASSVDAIYTYKMPLTDQNNTYNSWGITNNLTNSLSCTERETYTLFPELIDVTVSLNQKQTVYNMTQT